jgi:hypothetical protein
MLAHVDGWITSSKLYLLISFLRLTTRLIQYIPDHSIDPVIQLFTGCAEQGISGHDSKLFEVNILLGVIPLPLTPSGCCNFIPLIRNNDPPALWTLGQFQRTPDSHGPVASL